MQGTLQIDQQQNVAINHPLCSSAERQTRELGARLVYLYFFLSRLRPNVCHLRRPGAVRVQPCLLKHGNHMLLKTDETKFPWHYLDYLPDELGAKLRSTWKELASKVLNWHDSTIFCFPLGKQNFLTPQIREWTRIPMRQTPENVKISLLFVRNKSVVVAYLAVIWVCLLISWWY